MPACVIFQFNMNLVVTMTLLTDVIITRLKGLIKIIQSAVYFDKQTYTCAFIRDEKCNLQNAVCMRSGSHLGQAWQLLVEE